MTPHVTDLLAAYHDGELSSNRRHLVDKHLQDCQTCRAELEALGELSSLLRADPVPYQTPPERFAAQVQLKFVLRCAEGSADFNEAVEFLAQLETHLKGQALLSLRPYEVVFQPEDSDPCWAEAFGDFVQAHLRPVEGLCGLSKCQAVRFIPRAHIVLWGRRRGV